MKISEIEYKRVNIEEYRAALAELIEKIKRARSADGVMELKKQVDAVRIDADTYYRLAFIRWSINTKDEFYKAEKDYYDENMPTVDKELKEYAVAMCNSPYRAELEKRLPKPMFKTYENMIAATDERIIPDMCEENRLVSEYSQFMSELVFDFRGNKIPLSILRKYMSDSDRETRREAYETVGKTISANAAFLDDNYDKLVKVRDGMAKKLGYKNYVELGYKRMNRLFYTSHDIQEFREHLATEYVPVVARLRAKRGKELGIDKLMVYDEGAICKKDPQPILDAEGIFKAAREMYRDMSAETGDFFDKMLEADAFDVFSKEGKWGGGYCETLPKFKQPFILANFNGSNNDLGVITHEAGHAFADYMSYKNKLDFELNVGGMETAETHSMSMEFFCWKYMEKFFGKNTNDFLITHLAEAFSFPTYGIIVDAFQHVVYENPNLTPKERCEEYLKLEKKFRPFLTQEGVTGYEDGRRWQYQMHIFESPFYYIDYVIAQMSALQFLFLSLKDYDDAFRRYFTLLCKGGEEYYTEELYEAGLESPFKAGVLKKLALEAEEELKRLGV